MVVTLVYLRGAPYSQPHEPTGERGSESCDDEGPAAIAEGSEGRPKAVELGPLSGYRRKRAAERLQVSCGLEKVSLSRKAVRVAEKSQRRAERGLTVRSATEIDSSDEQYEVTVRREGTLVVLAPH